MSQHSLITMAAMNNISTFTRTTFPISNITVSPSGSPAISMPIKMCQPSSFAMNICKSFSYQLPPLLISKIQSHITTINSMNPTTSTATASSIKPSTTSMTIVALTTSVSEPSSDVCFQNLPCILSNPLSCHSSLLQKYLMYL